MAGALTMRLIQPSAVFESSCGIRNLQIAYLMCQANRTFSLVIAVALVVLIMG